jgi:hypothetical protein
MAAAYLAGVRVLHKNFVLWSCTLEHTLAYPICTLILCYHQNQRGIVHKPILFQQSLHLHEINITPPPCSHVQIFLTTISSKPCMIIFTSTHHHSNNVSKGFNLILLPSLLTDYHSPKTPKFCCFESMLACARLYSSSSFWNICEIKVK